MPAATQFCVGLENKPGMLAKLCADLKRAGVNIDALFVSDDEQASWVNFVPSPDSDANKALCDCGYKFVTEPVLTVSMVNRPGVLEGVAGKLAKAGVNIDYVYGSSGDMTKFMLVLSVDDIALAEDALKDT